MAKARVSSTQTARPRVASGSGFTLVEVLLAIVVLAAGVTTIYGLQAANARATLQISNENQAVLLARQFFATLDARPEPSPPVGEQTVEGTFEDIYRGIGMKAPPFSEDALARYRVTMVVDQWTVGDLLKRPMRRMQLTIRWGGTARDHITLTYFFPPLPI